jgi:hypothetical protein
MEYSQEIKEFVIEFLKENPDSDALKVGKALNGKFSDIPANRKSGNQVLYRMDREKLVICTRLIGKKPSWKLSE